MRPLLGAALAAAALVAGCLTAESARTAGNVALAAALVSERGTRAQTISGVWNGHAFTVECVLRSDGETLAAVFLAPQFRLGTMTLKRDGALVWERHRLVPETLEPDFLLFDLACVNLPRETLARALGRDWRVTEDGRVRRVSTRLGENVCRRTALAEGAFKMENFRYGYEYEVRPATVEEE